LEVIARVEGRSMEVIRGGIEGAAAIEGAGF
jgi:hypothetical protein